MSIDAMKQALEALEMYLRLDATEEFILFYKVTVPEAITALRAAIEQAKSEQELVCVCGAIWEGQELVSAPSQRQWQGLTDEEVNTIWRDIDGSEGMLMRFARAIEVQLRERNTCA